MSGDVKEDTVTLGGWWSFLLKTWLVAFPVAVSAIIGNISWLNYETVQNKFFRPHVTSYMQAQAEINRRLEEQSVAGRVMQAEIMSRLRLLDSRQAKLQDNLSIPE